MIDWTEVDRAAMPSWIALSTRLIDRAQTLLTSDAPVEKALRESQLDLAEFVAQANLQCPDAAVAAIRRTSDQVTRALQAVQIQDLQLRTATFEAIKARMSSAANELRADAARLRLEPARKALTVANAVASKVRALAIEVKGLRKDELPGKLGELLAELEELAGLLRGAVD
jgi:hypothetical protein